MFSRIINSIEESVIALLLATMTLLVFVEVILRFGFGIGLMWSQELTLTISAWMVLFGVSYGIKVGSHIGVDALVKIMPPTARRIISGISVVACLAYCSLFIKGAWVYLAKMHLIGIELEDMPIPKWIAHSILLIGMIMIAIRLLILLWNIVIGKTDGFKLADEAKDSMHLAEETKAATTQGGKSA
ncbi:C4-dicarboxylate transporter, DctQ subunit [Desulfuromusa kysingii]|uniref:C4-dicarboxylate transporter, DctQ subunit n=1 Tax=Desulfuromusa kysingii TaxID=37625 RepID=A0A1H3ZF14_9BACT|nr:TRAP transporter small permease [Desulfuromusa kysingii]SEA22336.1 C4-dicarboxylate transporter, DctQ subunit [Desulfuromusa kysingii]